MSSWLQDLRYDAVQPLLNSGNIAIEFWTRADVLKEKPSIPKSELWNLQIPAKILRKQNADGSWTYPTKKASTTMDYDQVETYRQLGFLVTMFGFDRSHQAIQKAAKYIFSKQSKEGDFRGIYAAQYSPNYTAAFLELLIIAGYQDDPHTQKAFDWLEHMRQNDGAWALPFRTQDRNLDAIYEKNNQIQPDKTKPFSHFVTGVVLRAYAANPKYRHSQTAKTATHLLVSRFFEKDVYTDKNHTYDWTRFSYPFWQTDILSSLYIVSSVDPGLSKDKKVIHAKEWFMAHQESTGLFTGHLLRDRFHDLKFWYSLAVSRIFADMK